MIVVIVIFRRAYSRPDGRVARLCRVCVVAIAFFLLATAGRTQQITLALDDLTGAGFSAQGISIVYAGGAVAINIRAVAVGAQSWKNIKLDCVALRIERARIACDEGVFALAEKIPLSFNYLIDKRVLDIAFKPAKNETWRVNLRPGKRGNDLTLRIDGGRVQRVSAWLPPDVPKIGAGMVNGVIDYGGDGRIQARLALSDVGFSDASGLHAGEKMGIALDAAIEPAADHVRWNATITWHAGETFWQPLYVKAANQQLSAAGIADAKRLRIEQGILRYPGVGDVTFTGAYDLAAKKMTEGSVAAQGIQVPALYDLVLKPFLEGTSLSDLRTGGSISAQLWLTEKGMQRADVRLDKVSFEDRTQRRFALFDINGAVPWRADAPTQAQVTVQGGELLKMPLGAFAIPLGMNGLRFDLKQLRVPLLDGFIDVRDFVARAGSASWDWRFTGAVGGISMDKFTAALGLPVMHGTLAATLPTVRQQKSAMRVDGALSLKVFDGTLEAKNLVLLDIFGKAPRVQADVVMQNLDLGLVTRTYSFGNITGRMDARIAGLELVNWQPLKFDARLESSAGDYPRKISQAAVQNISALGGAGAAAAIQRSVLRFFEEFGYDKLGWACKLQNGVCEMSGVEDRPSGYVIVKGGGIPAITVIGYNRRVDWQELLNRIKRVTQGNVKAIVE